MTSDFIKTVIEAVLICATTPLPTKALCKLFDDNPPSVETVRELLTELQTFWQQRGLRLCETASGWRFQSAPEIQPYFEQLSVDKPLRYSRALMETLAIIAYKRRVTRGDIEEIRGVVVNPQIIRQLEERGWIKAVGVREVPGRPTEFSTTQQFLDDLGLKELSELPAIEALSSSAQADLFASTDGASLIDGVELPADLIISDSVSTDMPLDNLSSATNDRSAENSEIDSIENDGVEQNDGSDRPDDIDSGGSHVSSFDRQNSDTALSSTILSSIDHQETDRSDHSMSSEDHLSKENLTVENNLALTDDQAEN